MTENKSAFREDNDTRDAFSGFPCAGCGSQMRFSPEAHALFCDYCKREEKIIDKAVVAEEYTFNPKTDTTDAPVWDKKEATARTCPSCGAGIMIPAANMTATCPYCGSHFAEITADRSDESVIAPEYMIPFRLSDTQAAECFQKWIRKRWMAPFGFAKKLSKTQSLRGVYFPNFTYDTDLFTDYVGEGGTRRTETYYVTVDGKREARTRTVVDWEHISGFSREKLDDILVPASKKINASLFSSLSPYSTKTMLPYNPAYLAGFLAERYDIGTRDTFATAASIAERSIIRKIEVERGYDEYRFMRYRHDFRTVRFKHILLPAWVSSYSYQNKDYQFLVNGETGKVAGKFPVSALKIVLIVLAALGIAAGIYFAVEGNPSPDVPRYYGTVLRGLFPFS